MSVSRNDAADSIGQLSLHPTGFTLVEALVEPRGCWKSLLIKSLSPKGPNTQRGPLIENYSRGQDVSTSSCISQDTQACSLSHCDIYGMKAWHAHTHPKHSMYAHAHIKPVALLSDKENLSRFYSVNDTLRLSSKKHTSRVCYASETLVERQDDRQGTPCRHLRDTAAA